MAQSPETPLALPDVPAEQPLTGMADPHQVPLVEVPEGIDSTHGGLVGQALLAGVSARAIKDMCEHDDPPRLLRRAIATMDRYCDPVRIYSQGVNYHLDGRTAETRRDFIDYVRGSSKNPSRGQRYKARALVRRAFDDGDQFKEFMLETGKRAHGIREQQKRRPTLEQRQGARDLAAAQENKAGTYTPPSGLPTARQPMQVSTLVTSLYSRLSPDLQKQWWDEYVLGHAGIIKALNANYLGQTILDTRRFPDLSDPQTGQAIARLVIRPDNIIAVGDRTAQLATRQQLLVFNALLLLKGQTVTARNLARIGVTAGSIKDTMSHFQATFNRRGDPRRHIFQKDVVWLDGAYRLNGNLVIMDMRPPQDPEKSVFAAFAPES